ncbi:MAG: hypothetical protein HRF43_18675, partial [Phycisphaerae bacterium]
MFTFADRRLTRRSLLRAGGLAVGAGVLGRHAPPGLAAAVTAAGKPTDVRIRDV